MTSQNALKDVNSVSSLLAVLNTDAIQGTNLVRIAVKSINGALEVDDSAAISFTMKSIDPRDANYASVWAFQGTDGNLYPAVATASGALLISHN